MLAAKVLLGDVVSLAGSTSGKDQVASRYALVKNARAHPTYNFVEISKMRFAIPAAKDLVRVEIHIVR